MLSDLYILCITPSVGICTFENLLLHYDQSASLRYHCVELRYLIAAFWTKIASFDWRLSAYFTVFIHGKMAVSTAASVLLILNIFLLQN